MRIVVSGASGFIGGAAARALVAAGHSVAVVVRDPAALARRIGDSAVTVIAADLAAPEAYRPALDAFAPEAALHCAWGGITRATRDDVMAQAPNFTMTLAFLDACAKAGAKTWVGLGSQAEYGIHDCRLDEAATTTPATVYGAIKLATFTATRKAAEKAGLRFAWVRVFHAFGPGDDANFLVPSLIRTLLKGERMAMTAGTQMWDLLHIDDVATALAHVATHPTAQGVFNLGSGCPRSVRRIAEDIRDAIDPALTLGFGEIPLPASGPTHLEADIGRLLASGWHPAVPWEQALRSTIAWHRAQD
ncbi:MAG: NAD(P)-dependent oxidoreductase [Magnetospirillum sp.]|nr:NAD(P)-dependent oxidoreductase [Magnetospirillum sp.]